MIELVGAYGVDSQSFNFNPVYGQTWGNDNYIESLKDLIFTTSNPPSLSDITGASALFVNNGDGSFNFNVTAVMQSINSITAAGTSNILSAPATDSATAIYVVTTKGKTYPIDNSSTISIRQDVGNTEFIYLDLKPSALSNCLLYTSDAADE